MSPLRCTEPAPATAAHCNGFTLLEVMVAVVIMMSVYLVLFSLGNRSVQDVQEAAHITVGSLLAQREMVETLDTKPLTVGDDEGTFPEEEYAAYTWKKSIGPTPLVGIYEVRVSVQWMEGSRQESVDLVSYEQ